MGNETKLSAAEQAELDGLNKSGLTASEQSELDDLNGVKKKEPTESTTSVSAEPVSQDAKPLEQVGTVEPLPKTYDRLNPKSYSNLQDGTNYFTGAMRNGKPVVKKWNAAAQEFQIQDDPKVLEVAQTKFGGGVQPTTIEQQKDIARKELTAESDKGDEIVLPETGKIVEKAGIGTYKNKEVIANEAAKVYAKTKIIAQQPQVSQYMQIFELYKSTDDPTAKEEIATKLEELKSKPFDFLSTPTEGAEKINLQTAPDTPKFKTVGDAVNYTLESIDESRLLLSDYAQTERDLIKINEEYQQLSPQDPKGFWYNAIRAVEDHSETLNTANGIALNSDEGAMNELENSYIKSQIFPKAQPEGAGKAGEFVGGIAAAVAPTVGATMATTTLTGNPLVGMLMGGAYSAQDMARIQYANGFQEMYNEVRSKDPNMPQNLAYETAKKYAQQTSVVSGAVGMAVGMFLPALKPETAILQKTSADIAKKFFVDVAKNSGFDFGVGATSQGLNNYIAKNLGSDRSIFDGVLESGGMMALQGLMVGTLTHGFPAVSKYVTAKNREQAINSLASSNAEQLESVFDNAIKTGSNPVEVQQLKAEVLERLEALNQMPPNLSVEDKLRLAPLYEERQKLVTHLKDNPASESGVLPEIEKLDRKIAEQGAYPLTEREQAEYIKLRDTLKEDGKLDALERMKFDSLKKRLEAIKENKADAESSKGGDGEDAKPEAETGVEAVAENGKEEVVAEVVEVKEGVKPTMEDVMQLSEVHKNLAAQYVAKKVELAKQGIRGEDANNHPDIVELNSQMEKIEKFFKPEKETPSEDVVGVGGDYYIKDGKEFKKVDNAKPVKLDTEGDFFAVKNDNGGYTIHEAKSGVAIDANSFHKTIKDAVNNANEKISKNSETLPLSRVIDGEIKRDGLSPRYSQNPKENTAVTDLLNEVNSGKINADDAAIKLDESGVEVSNEVYDQFREAEANFKKGKNGLQVGDAVTVKGKNGNPDFKGNFRGITKDGKYVVVGENGYQNVYEKSDIIEQSLKETPKSEPKIQGTDLSNSEAIKFLDDHTVDGPIQKYDLHPDFELSSEEIARGTKQIRNGEFDKAGAKKMLAKIDEWKRQGYVDYIRGSGKQMQKTSVPFELTEAMAQLPKEKAEAVKELHDKVEEIIPEISDEEAQSQVDKILATFTDENGNIDFKRIAEEYKGWNPAILELSAKADELLKSKIDESRANQKDATEGSTKADTKGGDSGEGGIKKTIVTKRAYEGEFREGVKKELERIGLTREVESQAEAKNKAKEFVDSVGEEAALDAVRNNDIQDAGGAYVWNELIERNQKKMLTETDPAKISDLESEQANLIEEFGRKALSGGRFSSALGDIYEKSDLGYNLQKKIADYKEQNGGVIPIEIEAKFREYDKQLKEISTRLAEAEQRAKEAEEKRAIENIKEEVAREKKKSRPIVYGKKRIAKGLDDLASALGARLSATGEEAVKVTDALTEIGRGLIEEGIATGENVWQKVKEYVSDKFGDKLKDIDSYEKDVKEKIEGGRTYGNIKIPKSLIKELVARGINNIDELTAAVKERVKDEYPNASDREIRDAITGYGKMSNLNQGEIETQIRKIARAGKIISALEDIAKKKRPLRSGAQRDKLDADERAMQKQLREAMKGLPVDEGAEAQQLKTQLDAAKQRVKNQIDDLEREINNGELVPKDSRTVKEDAELKSLKEKRDELKKEHDAIFKDEEFKQARRLELTKKANERRLDELKKKLREGDFSKKERKPLIADDELIKLKAEKLRIQEQYDVEFYKNKLANRTTSERWKDRLWEIWSLPRALMATGEWSFVGVQGLKLSLSHPQYAAQAFKNAWKAMLSEKKTTQFLNEIKSQEWYPTMKNSKLSLTEPHAEVTAREETFNSSWSNLVWNLIGYPTKYVSDSAYDKWIAANPMKALERASVGYLDTMRVLRFLDGMETLREQGKTFENSPQDYKDVADMVNTFTGRASLGKAEQIAEPLSKLFFSPRNWASAFKTGTPYAFYHFGKMTPTARKMALSDYSKFVGLTTSAVALAAYGLGQDNDEETSVELDPRSIDFMKVKLGNRHIDPWGGMQQQVVFSARVVADMIADIAPQYSDGGYKDYKGNIMRLGIGHKTPTKQELAMRVVVNKLGPSAALFNKYMSSHLGKDGGRIDQFGNPLNASSILEESSHPIFWGTVADLYKDDPSALNGLLAFYSFFGGGVNVYQGKKKK